MWPVTTNFLNAITGSHSVEVRAAAYLNGAIVTGAEDLLVTAGSVRVDGSSAVRRQFSASVTTLDGRTSTLRSLLKVAGTEIAVRRGVRYPNGSVELAPVGRFRIDVVDDDLAAPGSVDLTAPDLFARVVDDRFLTPRAGTVGITIGEMIRRLITETIPAAVVVDRSGSTATMRGGIVWERDRGQAVQDLATSIGCDVYVDPSGSFVIAPRKTLSDAADWLVDTGSRGVLLGGKRSSTREGVYNSISASAEATDGTDPIYAVVEDTDPTSATYVGGPYGRVPRFYSSPLITTTTQARSAASSLLSKALGARGSLELETLVNPALEVGDRIDAYLPDGNLQRHITESFELPLAPGDSMTITTRSAEEVDGE